MTSDRGNSRGAEMKLSNTPVTPKTPGLNPNALEFQSKTPAAPQVPLLLPDSPVSPAVPSQPSTAPPAPVWSPDGADVVAVRDPARGSAATPPADPHSPDGFVHLNGSVGELGLGVNFPPTPDSPDQPAPSSTVTAEFSLVNGTLAAEILFPSTSDGSDVAEGPMEGTIPDDQLRAMLKTQLEYYFSRENLANDSYLVSQMDADQYVPITVVAGFNQVKRLTHDHLLVVQILRESANVQVDDLGGKVRPLHKRCVVILREIPDTTPLEDVKKLFSGKNCPRFVSCEFAHNNSWYVTFEGDEDAQRAYQYLREEVRTFLGRPIMARIKAKPLLRSSFVPKNGFKQTPQQYDPTAIFTPQQPQPQQQQQQQQQQQPAQPTAPQRFTYTQVPSTTQYTLGQQSYPFFPPTNTMMHSWPNPLPFFDPGTAFAANGYTPTSTYKQPNATSHRGYQNIRSRGNQNNKAHSRSQGNPDRSENRPVHERHGPLSATRSSPRSEPSHLAGPRGQRSERHGHGGGQEPGHGPHHHHLPHNSHHHQHHHLPHQTPPPNASSSCSASSSSSIAAVSTTTTVPTSSTAVSPSSAGKDSPPAPTSSTSSSVTATSAALLPSGPHATPVVSSAGLGVTTTTVGGTMATSASTDASCDPTVTAASAISRGQPGQGQSHAESQKEPLGPRRVDRYRSRRRREEDVKGPRSAGPLVKEPKLPGETPKFELETASFPPLPGSTNKTTTGDVFENKMSDVVKGTARPLTREAKPVATTTPVVMPTSTVVEKVTPVSAAVSSGTSRDAPSIMTSSTTIATTSQSVTADSTKVAPAVVTLAATAPPATSAVAMTTAPMTTPIVTMATMAAKAPAAKMMVVKATAVKMTSSSVVKEKAPVNPTVNGLASIPTPPQSPQKPVKSTSLELTPLANKMESAVAPAPGPNKQDDASLPVRLSYAQMVQRTKEREAERQKDGGGSSSSGDISGTNDSDSTPAGAAASSSTTPRMQGPLREQTQTQRSSMRADGTLLRKDRDDACSEQRPNARRAKENRDRRAVDVRLPEREGSFRRKVPEAGEPARVLTK